MRGRRQNLQVTRAAFRAEQIYILYLGTTARCERLIAGTTWRQLAGRPAGSTRPSPPARSAPSPARPLSSSASSPVWFPAPVGANKKDTKMQVFPNVYMFSTTATRSPTWCAGRTGTRTSTIATLWLVGWLVGWYGWLVGWQHRVEHFT